MTRPRPRARETGATMIWIPTAVVPALDAEAKQEGRSRQGMLEDILRERYKVPRR